MEGAQSKFPTHDAVMWPGLDVYYLILQTDTFIVFLDSGLDVDWQTSQQYDRAGPRDPKKCNDILSRAAALECIPNQQHSKNVRLSFKRMIGESIAKALDHDYESAFRILDDARDYITQRNVEVARFWQLSIAFTAGLLIGLVGLVLWASRLSLVSFLGEPAFFLTVAFLAGGEGAVLSMIFRMGNSFPNSDAPKKLHIIEAMSRALAGSLSGFLVAACVKTGFILPMLKDPAQLYLTMIAVALAAGTSERWAPSIIARIQGENWGSLRKERRGR